MAGYSTSVDIAKAMFTTPVPLADWLVIAPSILTIIGGSICLILRKNTGLQAKLGLVFLGLLVLNNFALLGEVLKRGVITMVMGNWLPPFGIAFTVDALGATLALVAAIVAFCAGLYASITIDSSGRRYGFYPFLLLMMTGANGAFLTGDIFNMYVWFEVLLISSYGLLVLGNDRAQLDGTVKYGILNLIGTNLFLIATGLLYGQLGTLNMADITIKVQESGVSGPLMTIAVLYLLAFAMKAAAFPVNFWLPSSYHTPRIVVAAIFAGLLTKVGIYALLRTLVMLMPAARAELAEVIAWVAALTMLTGVIGAIAQSDLRRLLGYLVISGIGSMMAGMAIGSVLAVSGTVFYAVHSILVMTALYMAAGLMAAMAGSYDLRRLGGLYGASPLLAAVFLVLALAVAGLPPFSGFWPKVMLVDAALQLGWTWLAAAILVTGFLTSLAIGRVWIYAFWRGGPEGTVDGGSASLPSGSVLAMAGGGQSTAAVWIPLAALTALVVLFGLLPEWIMEVSQRGASGLIDPVGYLRSVFGGGA
ncbi:Na+/H+ antiporter subunit D [Microvirga tunisiensis]|uniref:Na+/H+ antiporter subunit D n=1 Tax=Pannonibacter tanglangensis TaxID=2750084 RepID=A0A7X5F2D9_9HYPH|nr:Na+/H+ antiporter subunit D [Pannonibacter sp. XCT-53]NBN78500.1 Na+/H+ antiporter subunit D [Pannonibacter sp. XCT-53]